MPYSSSGGLPRKCDLRSRKPLDPVCSHLTNADLTGANLKGARGLP